MTACYIIHSEEWLMQGVVYQYVLILGGFLIRESAFADAVFVIFRQLNCFYILHGGDVLPPIGGYTSSLLGIYILRLEEVESIRLFAGFLPA